MRINGWMLSVLLLLISCENFPKDPDKTLANIRNGILKVGYSENPPWVIKTPDGPTGTEAELIKSFAQELPARIQWHNDSEEDLFEQLEKRELHLVIGGITDKNAWKSKISFTKPYLQTEKHKYVIAIIKGENAFVLQLEKFLKSQEVKIKAAAAL